MTSDNKKAAIAAAIILIGFGFLAFFLPRIMLAVGDVSLVAAAIVAIGFVLLFFAIFWLRGRYQRRRERS